MALHPTSNVLLQGKNGIDLPSEDRPYEEINLVEQGKYYGWPYCHSRGEVSPFFQGKIDPQDCSKKYQLPLVFMPAHTAPLGMLFYKGEKLAALKGKLLVTWHGYQKAGHRIVAYPVDNRGVPTSNNYDQAVFGWDPKAGLRPLGAPTGIAELKDGSILIVDDKNGAILRLSTGVASNVDQDNRSVGGPLISEAMIKNFESLLPFIKKNCTLCHANLQKDSSAEMLKGMVGSMLNLKDPKASSFYLKLKAQQMPPEYMREQMHFSNEEYKQIDAVLEKFISGLAQP